MVDAAAALRKIQVGRGAGELGLGGGMALLGALLIRRRGRGTIRLGGGFLAALIAGSSGLFLLPYLVLVGAPGGRDAVVGLHRTTSPTRGRLGLRQPAAVERADPGRR